MSDDLLTGRWAEEYYSMMELLQEQYPGTENRGGLNISGEDDSWINAVLVPMTDEELDFYEEAEMGYHLEEIDSNRIDASVNNPVFAAVSHSTGDSEPIRGYVEDCLDSWSDWSDEHRERFLESTRVGGETLHE